MEVIHILADLSNSKVMVVQSLSVMQICQV